MSGQPIIEIAGLAKSFRIPSVRRTTVREHLFGLLQPRVFEELAVLRDIDLRIAPGEVVGIMGRNGSGKSTLLKIVSGIYPANRGTVTVRAPLTPILELGVGWNPELDAIDNALLLGTVLGLSLREARGAVGEILAFAELERFAKLELKHYSSGMSARLAYAVAFRAVREILVLDEIFAVGDAGFKQRCETRCRELAADGHTILLVSHDAKIVETFCQRAILLEGGRITLDGEAAAVAAAYTRLLVEPGA